MASSSGGYSVSGTIDQVKVIDGGVQQSNYGPPYWQEDDLLEVYTGNRRIFELQNSGFDRGFVGVPQGFVSAVRRLDDSTKMFQLSRYYVDGNIYCYDYSLGEWTSIRIDEWDV